MLSWCLRCNERSCVVRCYNRKVDGKRRRVEYCINRGCSYVKDLTLEINVTSRKVDNGSI